VRTIVIVGASNVTIGLPMIWSSLQQSVAEPLRLVVAAGHGRSYGMPSTVLGRTLPSIQECGLWEFLQEHGDACRVDVLLTDVGNDLLYGADVAQTLHWVTSTVDRLEPSASNLVLTELPVNSLQQLSRNRFRLFRQLLFPSSQLTYESAREQAVELNERLVELAGNRCGWRVSPEPHWYGFDPIHIRRWYRAEAWTRYLSPLEPDFRARRTDPLTSWQVWSKKPQRHWKDARVITSPQPAIRTSQSELWLF